MDDFDWLMMMRPRSIDDLLDTGECPATGGICGCADKCIVPGNTPQQTMALLDHAAKLANPAVRVFGTGATRDTDEGKLDFEGFLSPLVLRAFAEYMNEKRKMPDGSLRDSDNWQKGIPLDAYMKSMWRHFFAVWESYRDPETTALDAVEEMLALFFNVQGMLHETLKAKQHAAEGR